MKHKALVHCLLTLWFCCAYRLGLAATLTQDVLSWDYTSLFIAVVGGLVGGALRIIYSLASDDRAVFSILKEARRDIVVSMLAGGFVYIVMIAVDSSHQGLITPEWRFAGILIAGWTRHAAFIKFGEYLNARIQAKTGRARAGQDDPPSSAALPLEKLER